MPPSSPGTRPGAALSIVTAASFVAYMLALVLGEPVATLFSAFGVSACGWAWLFARGLFNPAPGAVRWPLALMAVLLAAGAASQLMPDGWVATRVVGNLYVLTGSAALLLTFGEPLKARRDQLSKGEFRFRIWFLIVFAGLVAVSMLEVWAPSSPARLISAAVGLTGMGLACVVRDRMPLQISAPAPREPRTATDEDVRLADRLRRLFDETQIYLKPELKISDIAAQLGEPEHRVSRCVSAATGFSNFNRLVNHHRIAAARKALESAADRRSILVIALDCGFASIGPFNRAFREETGMTPRAYRAAFRRDDLS